MIPNFIKFEKMYPARNCVNFGNSDSFTPRYNNKLLRFSHFLIHQNYINDQISSCSSYIDASVLLKTWLKQRGCIEGSGFILSMIMGYYFNISMVI